jgi:cell division protease FtsH
MALGYTLGLPEDDRYLVSRSKFRDDIAGMLGGRAAEELVFDDITTGAADDLERATKVARKMVTEFGMSDRLGPLTFGQKEELVFLGRELGEQRNYGEEVASAIDEEVRRVVTEAHELAKKILTENRSKLDRLAQKLIEVETLEGEEFQVLLEEEPLPQAQPEPEPEAVPPS